jgi:hypothetical protein
MSVTTEARSTVRTLLRWAPTFAAFPVGGLAAHLLVGPVATVGAAAVGGLVTGAAIGVAQWWALRPAGPSGWAARPAGSSAARWVVASALGLAAALALATAVAGAPASVGALLVHGAACGLGLGAAQAVVLFGQVGVRALLWPVLLAGAWTIGWAVTTVVGVRLEDGWTVFGSTGALVVTALTAVLPLALRRADRARS